jgi:hypothetical protein
MATYHGDEIIERFGLPSKMCSCPNCGRVYGTRLTGESVEVSSGFCEKCFTKEFPNIVFDIAYQNCDDFIAENT